MSTGFHTLETTMDEMSYSQWLIATFNLELDELIAKFYEDLGQMAHDQVRSMVLKACDIGQKHSVGPGKTMAVLVGLIGHQFGDLIRTAFAGMKSEMHTALLDSFRLGMAPTVGDALQVMKDAIGPIPATGKPPSVN